eukprot:scaffold4978_cov117-Isochrysis_galbana.AAC.14
MRPWVRGCGGSDFRRSRACSVASCGRLAQSNRPQPPAPPRPLAAFPKQARRVQCLELELAEVQTLLEKVRVSRPCAGGVMVAHPIAHSAPRRPPGVLSALPPFAPSSAFRRAVPSCRMATRRRWRSRSTCRRAALGLLVAGLGGHVVTAFPTAGYSGEAGGACAECSRARRPGPPEKQLLPPRLLLLQPIPRPTHTAVHRLSSATAAASDTFCAQAFSPIAPAVADARVSAAADGATYSTEAQASRAARRILAIWRPAAAFLELHALLHSALSSRPPPCALFPVRPLVISCPSLAPSVRAKPLPHTPLPLSQRLCLPAPRTFPRPLLVPVPSAGTALFPSSPCNPLQPRTRVSPGETAPAPVGGDAARGSCSGGRRSGTRTGCGLRPFLRLRAHPASAGRRCEGRDGARAQPPGAQGAPWILRGHPRPRCQTYLIFRWSSVHSHKMAVRSSHPTRAYTHSPSTAPATDTVLKAIIPASTASLCPPIPPPAPCGQVDFLNDRCAGLKHELDALRDQAAQRPDKSAEERLLGLQRDVEARDSSPRTDQRRRGAARRLIGVRQADLLRQVDLARPKGNNSAGQAGASGSPRLDSPVWAPQEPSPCAHGDAAEARVGVPPPRRARLGDVTGADRLLPPIHPARRISLPALHLVSHSGPRPPARAH